MLIHGKERWTLKHNATWRKPRTTGHKWYELTHIKCPHEVNPDRKQTSGCHGWEEGGNGEWLLTSFRRDKNILKLDSGDTRTELTYILLKGELWFINYNSDTNCNVKRTPTSSNSPTLSILTASTYRQHHTLWVKGSVL